MDIDTVLPRPRRAFCLFAYLRHMNTVLARPRRAFYLLAYLRNVTANFGMKFIIFLGCNYFFMKGAANILMNGVQLPYYKMLNIDAVRYQTLNVVAVTPWAMKGLIGSMV